jgi:hypothetical protein
MDASEPIAPYLRMSLQRLTPTQLSGLDLAGQAMRGSYSGKSLVESPRER